MTWLAAWRFLTSSVGRWLAIAGVAILAILAIRRDARKDVKLQDRADRAEDHIRRTDAGRAAAAQTKREMRAGRTPEEIMRDNDGAWGE